MSWALSIAAVEQPPMHMIFRRHAVGGLLEALVRRRGAPPFKRSNIKASRYVPC